MRLSRTRNPKSTRTTEAAALSGRAGAIFPAPGTPHEGWVVNLLADGRVVKASTTAGAIVAQAGITDVMTGGAELMARRGHKDQVVDAEQIATWALICRCGWTGPQTPAVPTDTRNGRYCPSQFEDFAARVWTAHVSRDS